jgi:hypothetical protein
MEFYERLNFLFGNELGEVFERSIIRLFGIRRKETAWYLPFGKMIRDAIATDSSSAARRIGAGTLRFILFNFTFHGYVLEVKVRNGSVS